MKAGMGAVKPTEETMRVLTQTELSRMTRAELSVLLQRISAAHFVDGVITKLHGIAPCPSVRAAKLRNFEPVSIRLQIDLDMEALHQNHRYLLAIARSHRYEASRFQLGQRPCKTLCQSVRIARHGLNPAWSDHTPPPRT